VRRAHGPDSKKIRHRLPYKRLQPELKHPVLANASQSEEQNPPLQLKDQTASEMDKRE
jgi:hypothetical protein